MAAIIVIIALHLVYQRVSNINAARQAEERLEARHSLTLVTNRVYYADTTLVATVQVHDMDNQPVKADISVLIRGQNEGSPITFETDYNGNTNIAFPLQGGIAGRHTMHITVNSERGTEDFAKDINIAQREGQSLIVQFDKGLYKPGDDVLFRILALYSDTAQPVAGRHYVISIFDGNDNRVFLQDAQTSDFGIMSGRFRLADEVNSGLYRLTVERDGILEAQANFEVSPYVLPKFEIILHTDKPQYNLDDTIYLTGNVRYFFGEPVNQGTVNIHINNQPVLEGAALDEHGGFSLSYIPQAAGVYTIFAEVIDNSNYRIEETIHIRVAEGPFEIELLPEHGYLVQGMPNRVYVFTNRADGAPVGAHLQISGRNFSRQVATDENGMGVFILEDSAAANHINVRGVDMDGNSVTRDFEFTGFARNITLSTNRPRYAMGETIYLNLTSRERDGKFIIYAYRNNRLLEIISTPHDQAQLNLGDVYGLIDIYAIWVAHGETRSQENLAHARKTVFIDPGRHMNLHVQSDRPEYRPGEFVNLDIGVTDDGGNPLTAALLVSMVDEAMLSLAANDLSIDNIRLALDGIRFSEDMDAATLYAALIAGASEQAITRIMLRQGGISPSIQTTFMVNPGYYWGPERSGQAFANVVRVWLLILLTSFFFILRPKKTRYSEMSKINLSPERPTPPGMFPMPEGDKKAGMYPDIPGYLPNSPKDDVAEKRSDKVITWIVIGALGLIIFSLFFLTSCGSGNDSAVAWESEHAPPQAPPPTADMPQDFPASEAADFDADDSAPHAGRPVEDIETQTARVRRLFLETMLFIPELIARDGHADLSFMLADNITTWNIQVVGNTMDGLVGHTETSIRAFQPFFVDFELPRNSIRHDQVSIPVTVFNYTDYEQTVILTIAEMDWFNLLAEPVQTMVIPTNQSQMVYVPIEITAFGDFVFRAYADTHGFADAAEKGLRVNPEGFRIERVVSSGTIERSIQQHLIFMEEDIPDTRRAQIKFYPSAMAQVIEGMENIFRMPFGCFEQTSSILFPNILALQYMQENNIDNPALTQRALEYISSGYQRLLTFEVPGVPGGFSLFGDAPAETVLTAYGLMQLKNLTSVYTIDSRVLDRMADFLFDHQNSDGSFMITGPWLDFITDMERLAFNAYITWAISEAFPTDPRLWDAVDYLAARLDRVDDNFTLALIGNALVNTGSPLAGDVLARLNNNVTRSGDIAYLTANSWDYFGTRGHAQDLQTTALASLAFSRTGTHESTNGLFINHIIANRDSWGTWHSTQATILSLMALTSYATASPLVDGQITVTIGDQQQVIDVSGDNTLDFYHLVFTGLDRENIIDIHFPDLGTMTYKISLDFYAPYDSVELERGFEVTASMPAQLAVHEWVDQEIRVINRSGYLINNAIVVVSIPQGFRVEASSLAALRNAGLVERYETRFEVINLYLRDIMPGQIIDLTVAYRPSYPVVVTGGHVRVFDYYNPWVEGFLMPVGIVVVP